MSALQASTTSEGLHTGGPIPSPSFTSISQVTMEPTWRGDAPQTYSFLLTKEELDRAGFEAACLEAQASGLPNPRVFTPTMFRWASIFHPAFFSANARSLLSETPARLALQAPVTPGLEVASPVYWLQSMLFLAGVTISAAIIQNRYSQGTLASKLDRLWQAAAVAESCDITQIAALDFRDQVLKLAGQFDEPLHLLLSLKHCFSEALAAIAAKIPVEAEELREAYLSRELSDRFGFKNDLSEALGDDLRCMIVYGSSVSSAAFADYDLILVVNDRDRVLRRLAGRKPNFRGTELNISVFGPQEFWTYQVISGDNLSHHGLCLWGETLVPRKTGADLLARNFSFGFIRLRQLLGMANAAPKSLGGTRNEDLHNLHSYFAKIPLNVARGILSAKQIQVTKEDLTAWAATTLAYSVSENVSRIERGDYNGATAAAAWATNRTLTHFNNRYCVCQ